MAGILALKGRVLFLSEDPALIEAQLAGRELSRAEAGKLRDDGHHVPRSEAPTPKAKPFNDPAWIWELKHDGYGALLIKDGERISLQTRNGNDLLHFFPEIAADLRKLPDIALDGELVMLDANGKPEFDQLRGRCAMKDPQRIGMAAVSKPAAVFAFDVCSFAARICARCLC
jgi:bifunctional non-homologous end joining protein LigD